MQEPKIIEDEELDLDFDDDQNYYYDVLVNCLDIYKDNIKTIRMASFDTHEQAINFASMLDRAEIDKYAGYSVPEATKEFLVEVVTVIESDGDKIDSGSIFYISLI